MEVFGVNEVGRKRVCVVGAGAAGLAAIRHIAASETLEGTVFESAGDIGGIWRDDGLTPLYKGLKYAQIILNKLFQLLLQYL